MQLITRNPFESDKRVDFNWWLKEDGDCSYCIHKNSKICDYCTYNKKKKLVYAY